MIALSSLVVEDGKFKKVYTVLQEYKESPDSNHGSTQITQEGIHTGMRVVTEDLTEEEQEELDKAISDLQISTATHRRADAIYRRRMFKVPF